MAAGVDEVAVRDMAVFLTATRDALRAEGVDSETTERVVNRVIWGDPHGGPSHRREVAEFGRELSDEERALIASAGLRE